MLQPSILRRSECQPYRLKESHQLVVQTQSKSQAEVFEVICYGKALTGVNRGVLLLHSHTSIPPWCKGITVSPSTIPFQTWKCCSRQFFASTGIPFLTPDCPKIINEAYSKTSQEALRVTQQFFGSRNLSSISWNRVLDFSFSDSVGGPSEEDYSLTKY